MTRAVLWPAWKRKTSTVLWVKDKILRKYLESALPNAWSSSSGVCCLAFLLFCAGGNLCVHRLPLNDTILLKFSWQVSGMLKGQLDDGNHRVSCAGDWRDTWENESVFVFLSSLSTTSSPLCYNFWADLFNLVSKCSLSKIGHPPLVPGIQIFW